LELGIGDGVDGRRGTAEEERTFLEVSADLDVLLAAVLRGTLLVGNRDFKVDVDRAALLLVLLAAVLRGVLPTLLVGNRDFKVDVDRPVVLLATVLRGVLPALLVGNRDFKVDVDRAALLLVLLVSLGAGIDVGFVGGAVALLELVVVELVILLPSAPGGDFDFRFLDLTLSDNSFARCRARALDSVVVFLTGEFVVDHIIFVNK